MKQWVLGCAISMALMGCTSVERVDFSFDGTEQVAQSYADVEWVETIPGTYLDFSIDENNQIMDLEDGLSAIAAFEIDTQGKEVDLEIVSLFSRTVFYPNALLLDEQNQVVKTFNNEDFKYTHSHALGSNRLVAETKIQPIGNQKVKLLIFTTPELIQGSTDTVHPSELEAMERGEQQSSSPTLVKVPHSPYGNMSVYINLAEASTVNEPVVVGGSQATPDPVMSTPVVVDSAASGGQTVATEAQRNFYISSIEKAVEAGMLDKAIALLEEAKALNIDGAQEAFIKAVNKQ
ncbi:MalM family protein [Vibrio sp. WXL103]|uniref:MalM family protein n=1 Tax=unclassified Vibrio TaxID=2614977 RepID=UPI003EC6B00E